MLFLANRFELRTTGMIPQLKFLALAALMCTLAGCYAPLVTKAIPASTLPEEYRIPWRTGGPPLNLSTLTIRAPRDYLLGPGDVLEITIPGLYAQSEVQPLRVSVMGDGHIHLPLVGSLLVRDMNLQQAHRVISGTYENGFIVEPRINVVLAEKRTTSVLVLGQVNQPGTYSLPKYENDVGHAIGAAAGLTEDAGDFIEVHRQLSINAFNPSRGAYPTFRPATARSPYETNLLPSPVAVPIYAQFPPGTAGVAPLPAMGAEPQFAPQILRIPLRGMQYALQPQDIVLGSGDVVVVPNRRHEVFFVTGPLSTTNTVRFTVGDRNRELGVGYILPPDREIDVVTAVAMAGYIDPIYSPTTVTVHRAGPDGQPMLILVDLIKARYDRRETVLVQPADIIYLNPDHQWWWRRAIDRIVVDAFSIPFARAFR